MSFNYARVLRDSGPSKNYGYDKVSPQELRSIVMRVQRPTVNSEQNNQFPDGYFKHPIRPNSGFCKRAQTDMASRPGTMRKRGVSPKVMNRMVRRLQTSTISRMAANGQIAPQYDAKPPSGPPGPRSDEENKKLLRRLTRPTSCSQRRDLDAYWDEMENSEYYDVDFSGEVPVGKEELTAIVDRVRTPTVASDHGERSRCPKRRPSIQVNRDRLPLVSGLARSRKVDDIVERLYKPTTASTTKRTSTTSTDTYISHGSNTSK